MSVAAYDGHRFPIVANNRPDDFVSALGMERDMVPDVEFVHRRAAPFLAQRPDPLNNASVQLDKLAFGIPSQVDVLHVPTISNPPTFDTGIVPTIAKSECQPEGHCHVSALKWGDFDWNEMVIRFRRKQVRGVV